MNAEFIFHRRFVSLTLVLSLICATQLARAVNTYISPDNNITFSYPGRWKAENQGSLVRLTVSDGSHYLLSFDTLSPLPADNPATDVNLKSRAAKLLEPILKSGEFVSVQSLTMDHGSGASFRYQVKTKTGEYETPTSIYIAVIGKHSIILMPEKAGQSSQSIGLASVFQSIAFIDTLPKAPPVKQRAPAEMQTAFTGARTINFQKQIAPIFKEKCEVCHRTSAPSGSYSVSTYSEIVNGGRRGAVIAPGRPETSQLLDYLTGKRDLMPKGGPALPDDQIALIRKWITEGATNDAAGSINSLNPAMENTITPSGINKQNRRNMLNGKAAQAPGVGQSMNKRNVQPTLLEAYEGHLISFDLSYAIRLQRDGTASAVWTLSPGRTVNYSGTYKGDLGNYIVSFKQAGQIDPSVGKTMELELRARGGKEIGWYTEDSSLSHKNIAGLELTEAGVPLSSGRANNAVRPQNGRRPKL